MAKKRQISIENLRGRHFVAGQIIEITSSNNMKEEFLLGSSIFIHMMINVPYRKRLLLRCIHRFKSDLINNMDHMRNSGSEPSSVILSQKGWRKSIFNHPLCGKEPCIPDNNHTVSSLRQYAGLSVSQVILPG